MVEGGEGGSNLIHGVLRIFKINAADVLVIELVCRRVEGDGNSKF